MGEYWQQHPPTHVSLRRICEYYGITKPVKERAEGRKVSPEAAAAEIAKSMPMIDMPGHLRAGIKTPEDAHRAAEKLFFGEVNGRL